jgi:hypothetical protein
MTDARRAIRTRYGYRVGAILRCAGAAWVVLLGGCYRYTAMSAVPGAGTDVRIHLTEAGGASLAPVLGTGTTTVTGRVMSATETDLVLAISETGRADGRVSWGGERITLPRSALASAEHRSLDRWRTVGVGAIGIGAAGAIALLVSKLSSGSGGDDDGGVIIPP